MIKRITNWVKKTCNKALPNKRQNFHISDERLRKEAKIFVERYGETLKRLAQE